jgi:hypothetical protein
MEAQNEKPQYADQAGGSQQPRPAVPVSPMCPCGCGDIGIVVRRLSRTIFALRLVVAILAPALIVSVVHLILIVRNGR